VRYFSLVLVGWVVATLSAQTPAPASVGPRVGAEAPAFSGVDQFGREHTLESVMERNGVMLVFFRSADW
jgi:hypothetical protein